VFPIDVRDKRKYNIINKMWRKYMWIVYALLSAFFAALIPIFGKIGIENINSNLATAIRTTIVLIFAWVIVFITGKHNEVANINSKTIIFLILSGIATGLSWIFYFKALQLGEVAKVMPFDSFIIIIAMILAFIFLKETFNIKSIIGGIVITIGTLIIML
jgi:transporter family protein